jgi:hypothetical protein
MDMGFEKGKLYRFFDLHTYTQKEQKTTSISGLREVHRTASILFDSDIATTARVLIAE